MEVVVFFEERIFLDSKCYIRIHKTELVLFVQIDTEICVLIAGHSRN